MPVRGISGEPIANTRTDAWQSDEDGLYDVQHGAGGRAACLSEP
jgi:hydroxyquinol 1,2-dioxygenase